MTSNNEPKHYTDSANWLYLRTRELAEYSHKTVSQGFISEADTKELFKCASWIFWGNIRSHITHRERCDLILEIGNTAVRNERQYYSRLVRSVMWLERRLRGWRSLPYRVYLG